MQNVVYPYLHLVGTYNMFELTSYEIWLRNQQKILTYKHCETKSIRGYVRRHMHKTRSTVRFSFCDEYVT